MTAAASSPPKNRRVIAIVSALVLAVLAVLVVRRLLRPKSDVVAVLTATVGAVDRDFDQHVGAWRHAAVKDEFAIGDGVRTGKASRAALTLSDKSELALEKDTVVRFLSRPSSHAKRFELEMGDAVLQAGDEAVAFGTEIGVAVLAPGSKISLRKHDQETRYEVSVGMARFEDKDGKTTDVAAGHGLDIGIGAATLEPYELGQAAPPTPPAPPPSGATPGPPPAEEPTSATGDVGTHVTGGGASVRAPGETRFSALSAGDRTVAAGSTLRLAAGTSADIERGGKRATLRGAGEFVIAEAGKAFIVTSGGGVSLTGAGTEVEVAVPGGSIVAKLGARGDVVVRRDAARVSVSAGTVEVKSEAGTELLAAGEELTIGEKGATEVIGRGPGYVDFVAGAGDSFAVHDPKPPTAIGIATASACPEGAVVELAGGRGRSRGTGTVSVLFPSGSNRYSVHCVTSAGIAKESAASGSIAVLHDGGTARIPRTAPSTQVDTDGRNYTVLYQNLLPKISVRWPSAPKSGPYVLHVASPGGKAEALPCGGPSHSFATGALREGIHRLSFEGGGARSKETQVDIRFDNAAPTATLTSPANGSFAPGSGVTVSGLALEGWKISVGGKDLPLDEQLRFSGEAQAPGGQRALAVEFVHPHRGVHYYLRRSAGH